MINKGRRRWVMTLNLIVESLGYFRVKRVLFRFLYRFNLWKIPVYDDITNCTVVDTSNLLAINKMMQAMQEFDEGYCVHDRGENPYPSGSPEATEWQRGWDQAESETNGYADRQEQRGMVDVTHAGSLLGTREVFDPATCETSVEHERNYQTMNDLDDMSIKDIRRELARLEGNSRELGEIKATLKVNCYPDRTLGKLGITYDEQRSVLHNVIRILGEMVKR